MSNRILIFKRTSDTIQASTLLLAAGIQTKVISLPEFFSFECGVSLVINSADQSKAEDILTDRSISPAGVYDYD